MHVRAKWLVVAIAVLALAGSTHAAGICYKLDRLGGEFSLWARTSVGDNGGLVLYSVPLLGNVTSVDNRTVNGIRNTNFTPVGFTDIRSADSGPAVNPTISGSQNIVTAPAANRLYGIGQAAGSLAAHGITSIGLPDPTCDQTWGAPFLLARGTYTGPLYINTASVDLVGNVWDRPGGSAAPQAMIAVDYDDCIPEPATLGLVTLALIGVGFLRRRRA